MITRTMERFSLETYIDNEGNSRHAKFSMSGVELKNLGQHDSNKSALRIIGVTHVPVTVHQCSFRNSDTTAISIEDSANISFTQNLIYDAVITGFNVEATSDITITDNVVIGTSKREFENGVY